MTAKELEDRLKGIEKKLDKMANLEERLEKGVRNIEKFRDKMIQKGYSYDMITEFNIALQPVMQYCNEIRNARKKQQALIEEQKRLEKEEKEREQKRKSAIVSAAFKAKEPEFPYHYKCRNFTFSDGEAICDVKMDLQYCGKNCPYATTEVCSNKVDGRGHTVVYKKRRY